MDYKSELAPVRDFIVKMNTVETITTREEYDELYEKLQLCNNNIRKCIESKPSDTKIREGIVKMHKAMD